MIDGLIGLYAIAGYWYFWRVLQLGASNPRDLVICAVLGLALGPILIVCALCAQLLVASPWPQQHKA